MSALSPKNTSRTTYSCRWSYFLSILFLHSIWILDHSSCRFEKCWIINTDNAVLCCSVLHDPYSSTFLLTDLFNKDMGQSWGSTNGNSRQLSQCLESEHNMLAWPCFRKIYRCRQRPWCSNAGELLYYWLLQFFAGKCRTIPFCSAWRHSCSCPRLKKTFKTAVKASCADTQYKMFVNSTLQQSGASIADPLTWAYSVACITDK